MTIWIALFALVLVVVVRLGYLAAQRSSFDSFGHFLWFYCLEEPILVLVSMVPGVYGMALRAILYRLLFQHYGHMAIVRESVKIVFPRNICLGANSTVNTRCLFWAYAPIRIGDGVRLAPGVCLMTMGHHYQDRDRPIAVQGLHTAPIVINDDVWVGINAVILSGVTIGAGAVVAAGAVVTRDVPPGAMVAGVPARVVKYRGGREPE